MHGQVYAFVGEGFLDVGSIAVGDAAAVGKFVACGHLVLAEVRQLPRLYSVVQFLALGWRLRRLPHVPYR